MEIKVYRGEGREEDLRDDWTKYRMMSKRRDFRLMEGTTVLHGGICHCTSTPHLRGNKSKGYNKIKYFSKFVKPHHGKQTIKQSISLRLCHYSQQ